MSHRVSSGSRAITSSAACVIASLIIFADATQQAHQRVLTSKEDPSLISLGPVETISSSFSTSTNLSCLFRFFSFSGRG